MRDICNIQLISRNASVKKYGRAISRKESLEENAKMYLKKVSKLDFEVSRKICVFYIFQGDFHLKWLQNREKLFLTHMKSI